MPVRPQRFVVKLSYQGQQFASVPVEVSPVEAGNAAVFDEVPSDALQLLGLPPATAVPCMSLPWQVAQKLHACTAVLPEPKRNDRAHDLVDLQLIETLLAGSDLQPVRRACVAVFRGRGQQPWPPVLVAPPHWPAIYRRALQGLEHLQLAPTVEEAVARVQHFVDVVDSGRVTESVTETNDDNRDASRR